MTRWNLAKGIVLPPFADARFHGGTPVIIVPEPGWREIHVGHPGTIYVTSQSEQRALRLVVGGESSRHHEKTGLRPNVWTILEFRHLPLLVHRFISQASATTRSSVSQRYQELDSMHQSGW